jgi:hypothetical protein
MTLATIARQPIIEVAGIAATRFTAEDAFACARAG